MNTAKRVLQVLNESADTAMSVGGYRALDVVKNDGHATLTFYAPKDQTEAELMRGRLRSDSTVKNVGSVIVPRGWTVQQVVDATLAQYKGRIKSLKHSIY